jgi:hypothetical protein
MSQDMVKTRGYIALETLDSLNTAQKQPTSKDEREKRELRRKLEVGYSMWVMPNLKDIAIKKFDGITYYHIWIQVNDSESVDICYCVTESETTCRLDRLPKGYLATMLKDVFVVSLNGKGWAFFYNNMFHSFVFGE